MSLLKQCLKGLLLAAPFCGLMQAQAQTFTGPSSSQSPYLVPTLPGVGVVSLITVGDSVNYKPDGVTPYRLVGLPDGLGAFANDDGKTFTLLVNHEIPGNGITREHGLRGAFVSKWIIDKNTFQVLEGSDLMLRSFAWSCASNRYVANSNIISRLCSADLPPISAFYDKDSKKGYRGHIYMNGEESGAEGRAFAHLMNGKSYELPALGKFSWENSVAHPDTKETTVVVGLDDSGGGQVYVYVGTKTKHYDPITAAGLNNGVLYGIKVDGVVTEDPAIGIPSGTKFTAVNLGDVTCTKGSELETLSNMKGVTGFNRPEDGCWDPKHEDDFYFVTTASFTGNSRLWRLRFKDAKNPAAGGKIDMLLDGSEGQKMMDNITIHKGKVIIQEDIGGNDALGKMFSYDIEHDTLTEILEHDPARFTPGAPGFLTRDEEASGVIPADEVLGKGWYLATDQAHYSFKIPGTSISDPEIVEGGQLVAIHIRDGHDDDDDDDHDGHHHDDDDDDDGHHDRD